MPDLASAAILAAQRAARGETGALRIGFTGSAAFNPLVPAVVLSHRRRFPDVEITLREGSSPELAASLREGLIDAAFLRPDALALDGLQSHVLDRERLVAAVPSAHPAARRGRLRLFSLADEFFILTPRLQGPTLFDAAVEACRSVRFEPRLGQSAPQIASVLALVAAELGVSLVPSSMRTVRIRGIAYCELTDAEPVAHIAIAHRRDGLAPAVRHFVEAARFNVGRNSFVEAHKLA